MTDTTAAVGSADARGLRRSRELGWLAVAALLVLVSTYLLLVRTAAGQSFDDQALVGRLAADPETTRSVGELLRTISRATLLVMAVVLLVVGAARHRLVLAVTAAGAFVGAVVSAEALKAVLPRPDLAPEFDALLVSKGIDTFPSGHATIATSFVLALVLVSNNRWRPSIALLGLLWASAVAAGTVAAGWHRPSDAVGGVALATCWLAFSASWLSRRRGHQVPEASSARFLPWAAGAVLVVALTGIAVTLAGGRSARVPNEVVGWAFPVGQGLVDIAAVAAVGTFAWLLRDLRFGAARVTPGG